MAAARGADGNSLAARGADGNNLAARGADGDNWWRKARYQAAVSGGWDLKMLANFANSAVFRSASDSQDVWNEWLQETVLRSQRRKVCLEVQKLTDVSGLPATSSHEQAGDIIARNDAQYEMRILRESMHNMADLEALVDDHPARRPATVNAARTTTTATEHAQQTQNLQLHKLCSEWSPILSFVGAHNLHVEFWDCTGCKPWWHNWECHQCEKSVPPAWTADRHFNACGQSCPCCRQKFGEVLGSCEECFDLWVLKTVSCDMRLTLRSYKGSKGGEGGASSRR